MSQEGCGELREIKIAGGLESWNPTLRKKTRRMEHPARKLPADAGTVGISEQKSGIAKFTLDFDR